MLEKLKLIIKYPAKLFLWSLWLGIQGFELIVGVIFRGVVCIVECIDCMTRLNLLEIGSTITKTLSDCIGAFLDHLYVARYPVRYICDRYTNKNLLLKLFLMVGFNPNVDFPLSRVTEHYTDIVEDSWLGEASASNAYLEKVKLLIEYGADINYQNQTIRDTPLELFIRNGWLNELDFLIEKGADVNNDIWIGNYNDGLIEIEYVSPLQYAANWGRSDTALLLIDKGASFEYSDIPRIFKYSRCGEGYREWEILRAIYNRDSNAVGELLQRYKNKRIDGVDHDKIEPIFRNVLSQHILPKIQDEQIKNQLNDFLSKTGNSVEDISAQASASNDLQNLLERQAEVVTIENIGKAQRGNRRTVY